MPPSSFAPDDADTQSVPLSATPFGALLKLAALAREAGRYAEALDLLRLLARQVPDNLAVQAQLARTCFYARCWEEAWPMLDMRFRLMSKVPHVTRRAGDGGVAAAPRWLSGPMPASLLVLAERDASDCLQFVAYLPRLCEKGCAVTLVAPEPLLPLLARVDARLRLLPMAESGAIAAQDAWCFLLDLPRAMNLAEADLLVRTPYLSAEAGRRARWDSRLPEGALRVGLAWRAPEGPASEQRSAPLAAFAPLAALPELRLIALEDHAEQDIAATAFADRITLPKDLDGEGDWPEKAALIAALDLVISVDGPMLHLAAALGCPTIALLHEEEADWRWLHNSETSVFYPNIHLLRREAGQDWRSATQRLADMLRRKTAGASLWPFGHRMAEAPLAIGDLIDRIAILELKAGRILDPAKLVHVNAELPLLSSRLMALDLEESLYLPPMVELRELHETLWTVMERLRAHERAQSFDADFIALARSAYQLNDRRAAIKRQINHAVASTIVEEKSHPPY